MKLNTKQAAEYLGVSSGTLQNWRYSQTVIIPYLKLGARIIYLQKDLDTFMETCKVGSLPAQNQ